MFPTNVLCQNLSFKNIGLSCWKYSPDDCCVVNGSSVFHKKGVIIGHMFGAPPIPHSDEIRETPAPTLQEDKGLRCLVSFSKFYAVRYRDNLSR